MTVKPLPFRIAALRWFQQQAFGCPTCLRPVDDDWCWECRALLPYLVRLGPPYDARAPFAIRCPFCRSSEHGIYSSTPLIPFAARPFYVHCNGCGAQGPRAATIEEAIEKWNH